MFSGAIIQHIQKNFAYKWCKITAKKKFVFLVILPYQQDFFGIGATIRIGQAMLCLPYAGFSFRDFKFFWRGSPIFFWRGGSKKNYFFGARSNKIWDGSTLFSKNWPSGPLLSISRNDRPFICLFVCLFTFEVPLKRLFSPHFPKSVVKTFQRFGILWGKVMERISLRFENFY